MKVAIVGRGDGFESAPYADQSWQIWVYDGVAYPRITISFSVPSHYHASAKQHVFPYEGLLADFGPYWFNSEPSWLIPFALNAGAKEIGLYGLDLDKTQSMAIYHWMWVCEQIQVPILVSEGSKWLEKPEIYGLRAS